MRTLWPAPVIVALALLFTLGSEAATTSLYVSPTGSDTAPCTQAAPCKSLNRAYQLAQAGDTVLVAGGSYPSQSLGSKTGAAAPNVVIREVEGERAILGNAGAETNCLATSGARYVTLVGFETSYAATERQCGFAVGRGSGNVRAENIDAGHIFVAADDVEIIGGDFGPTLDRDGRISDRTCSALDFSCMPRNVLIDGAVFHDHRRGTDHMQCISFDGGIDVTLRNLTFRNCAVFSIFVSGPAAAHFNRLTFENNVYEGGTEALSTHVKFSNHGATYQNVVMRNESYTSGNLLVSSTSQTDILIQGKRGPGRVAFEGVCSDCGPGVHTRGQTVVTIEGDGSPTPPPPPPPPPPPATASTSTACARR